MDEVQAAKTPAHLWIVGILSLLWSGFGAYDYWMTRSRNTDYLSQFADISPQEILDYIDSFPVYAQVGWGLGVWAAVAGSILLLMRSRWAVIAFGLSLLGIVASMGYQLFVDPGPPALQQGALAIIPWVVIVIGVALFYYARRQRQNGVLG